MNRNSTEGSYVAAHTHGQMLATEGPVNVLSVFMRTPTHTHTHTQGRLVVVSCSLPPPVGQTLLRLIAHNQMGGASLALLMHHFNLWTHKPMWSPRSSFLSYLRVKYVPSFTAFTGGFNPSPHRWVQLFLANEVVVVVFLKKGDEIKLYVYFKKRVNKLSPFTIGQTKDCLAWSL